MSWEQYNEMAKQEAKRKAEAWHDYKRQLLSSGRDDIVSAAEELADIGVRNKSYDEGTFAGTRSRQIGEEINRIGGFRLMQEIHKLFVLALFAKTDHENVALLSRRLESAWHGIGEWQS